MRALYAETTGESLLSGTPGELLALAGLLREGGGDLALPPVADPAPYDRALAEVRVRHRATGKVRIRVDGGPLVIGGAPEYLAVLAENVAGFAADPDAGPRHHLHVEHFPDHFYMAGDSAPLVVGFSGDVPSGA
ncbi:Imm32 family immunity protein [Nocardiopsis flavescens]